MGRSSPKSRSVCKTRHSFPTDALPIVFRDLRAVGCDLLTIGQYLKPTAGEDHISVERFYPPQEFDDLAQLARTLGFPSVASGPFVRSSYFAEQLYAGQSASSAP